MNMLPLLLVITTATAVTLGVSLALAISRHRRIEAARGEREERLRMITAQMPAVLWSTNTDLHVTNCLGAGIAPLRLPGKEVVSTAMFEIFRLSDQNLLRMDELKRALQGELVVYEVDWQGQTFSVHAQPLTDDKGRIIGTIGVAQDITARKQAEEELRATQMQLIQAAKLEIVGQMAASVAHEVKNPLNNIMFAVSYLKDTLGDADKTVSEVLAQIQAAVEKGTRAVRGLMDLAAPDELRLQPEDLNKIITGALQMMKHEFATNQIKVETHLAADLPPVSLDRHKIEQCLLNFCMNAVHAMQPNGGTLTVRTRLNERERAVVTEIDDTGHGIPPDKMDRLFQPFFTTKPKGKGSGLGLAVVKTILDLHHAGVSIANRPEGGIRITVIFPL
ncbi:MAG: PAS domain S-box protein [Verrucomicrobia bacterium]|nr:PAS domain S-box protein [Verrucomicrobiota bacterium]